MSAASRIAGVTPSPPERGGYVVGGDEGLGGNALMLKSKSESSGTIGRPCNILAGE